MTSKSDPNNGLNELLRRREEAEIQKLDLEIADLQRPMWRRPANWFGVITALVAVIGLFAQYSWNKIEVAGLQLDARLEQDRAATALSQAQAATLSAEENLAVLVAESLELEANLENTKAEIAALNAEKEISITEAAAARSRLEEIEQQLADAELSGEPLSTSAISNIRTSIGETYKGFACGSGTQFHCP